MRRARFSLLLTLVLCFCVTLVFALPWTRDMYNFPSLWPYEREMPLPPEGTLPVSGGHLPMSRAETGELLQNPVPSTSESIAQGQELYQIYCAVCHGSGAKGDGPAAAKLSVPPPDLTTEFMLERTDGFIYGTIRYGGVLMPALGSSLSETETWAIVNYLRSLRGQ